jgi:arginine decarboxylase-like protein
MIFAKEILEKINLLNLPTTNDMDITCEADGKINKYLFEAIKSILRDVI